MLKAKKAKAATLVTLSQRSPHYTACFIIISSSSSLSRKSLPDGLGKDKLANNNWRNTTG
jgi:hypothetical protein